MLVPTYRQPPWQAVRGEGTWLYDDQGRPYLDLTAGIGVNALGHAHPEVSAAIQEQSAQLLHTSNMFLHPGHAGIARWLVGHTFGAGVFLTNSGTEATEAALKLARLWFHRQGRPRPRFVAAHGSFHGRSFGALSITGQPSYQEGYAPLLESVTFIPFGDAQALHAAVDEDTAAVILEPVQGNVGVRVPSPQYLGEARAACDAHGALLILDEIQTGLGRTGAWYAHEHAGVSPDVMMTAKALGGGLPLGALVVRDGLVEVFQPGNHGSTFGGNPVACAAGLATLAILERDGLISRAAQLGERLQRELGALMARHGVIREVRGLGLMLGVEIDGEGRALLQACRSEGLLVAPGGKHGVRLLPPLNISDTEIADALGRLEAGVRAM